MIQETTLDFLYDLQDLPEETDDKVRIIPSNEYIPEWEEEVNRWLMVAGKLPENAWLPERQEIPQDLDKSGFQRWALEEIRRCIQGHNGLSGKMYFYYSYCWIQKVGRRIRPDFRVVDSEWFKFVEVCQKSKEWGVICVKRRRGGFSWKEAADALHDVIFNTYFNVGINSKTERDSLILFQKVKFLYEQLPAFLKVPCTASNTKSFLDFSRRTKDEAGNKQHTGNRSTILAVAPSDNAYEGQMLSKWICDEAGKLPNLATLWSYTEDCLLSETTRVGMPLLFGTAGDIGSEGKDLEYMWKNAKGYKLKRFFFSGWMGLMCNTYGNDDRENSIRWIIYERHRREGLRVEEYNTFIQKYPLSVAEAFMPTKSAGVGNIVKIRAQQASLFEFPPEKVTGFFKKDPKTEKPLWVPSPQGDVIIYEQPDTTSEGIDFVAGCDPADHDEVFDTSSDLSLYILKRPKGTQPRKVMLEYTARPEKVVQFYDQAILALQYYKNTRVLIERNRYGMINHFDREGLKHLLARTPTGVTRVVGGRPNTIGIQMTPAAKEYLADLIAEDVEYNVEWIPSSELLQEFIEFGAKNTDRAMAYGIALMQLQESSKMAQLNESIKSRVPNFGYVMRGGRIVRK